jgi:hypothetical protein
MTVGTLGTFGGVTTRTRIMKTTTAIVLLSLAGS